ncbi:MAG: alpha/beta hydrolase [Methylotenera sp.]|nr:alpha/beta hydrolase [Methylotenera sp.]
MKSQSQNETQPLNETQPIVTLILLPGMDGTGELFESFIASLNPEIKTVVISYPKTGRLSYEALTVLASAQIQSAQIPKDAPCIILGESFSGPIAIALAANATDQLKGLILSCTFASNPRPMLSKFSFLLPAIPITKFWLNITSKFLMNGFSSEKIYQLLQKTLPTVSPMTMRSRLEAVINVDYSAKLTNIKTPILYLRGRHDYLVPASASELIFKLAKNVTLVELDSPHLLLQVTPKEAAASVQAFIEKVVEHQT